MQKEMAQSVVADTGTNFLEISPAVFAEQLTLMDAVSHLVHLCLLKMLITLISFNFIYY